MVEYQESLNHLIGTIINGVFLIGGVYVTYLINKAVKYLKKKTEMLDNEDDIKLLNSAIDGVDNLIKTNIVAVENTLKPQLIKAIEDGKLDKEDLKDLSKTVKENTLNQLTDNTLEVLNYGIKDVDNYVETRIEKLLAEMKDSDDNIVNYTFINKNKLN